MHSITPVGNSVQTMKTYFFTYRTGNLTEQGVSSFNNHSYIEYFSYIMSTFSNCIIQIMMILKLKTLILPVSLKIRSPYNFNVYNEALHCFYRYHNGSSLKKLAVCILMLLLGVGNTGGLAYSHLIKKKSSHIHKYLKTSEK